MFFENEYLKFNLLDVLYLDQGNVNISNRGRSFDALSFRIESDAVLKYSGKEYSASTGSVSFIPSGLEYSRAARVDKCIVIHLNLDNPTSRDIEIAFPQNRAYVESLFVKAYDIWRERVEGYKLRAASVIYEILAECCRVGIDSKDAKRISAGVDYLNSNYASHSVNIGEAAKRSFMSEVYFRKLFKKEMGQSPKAYVISRRMQKAVNLINTGYYTLLEISDACGYNDYKFFSVEFKRSVGCSPSDYVYRFKGSG